MLFIECFGASLMSGCVDPFFWVLGMGAALTFWWRFVMLSFRVMFGWINVEYHFLMDERKSFIKLRWSC